MNLPGDAWVRYMIVASRNERFSLTNENICKGDVVFQIFPKKIFVVVDTSKLNNEEGYILIEDLSAEDKKEEDDFYDDDV